MGVESEINRKIILRWKPDVILDFKACVNLKQTTNYSVNFSNASDHVCLSLSNKQDAWVTDAGLGQ